MLESSKKILGKSNNTSLQEMGSQDTRKADYDDGIPVAQYKDKKGYLKLDINATTVIGVLGPSGAGKTTGDMAIASRAYKQGRVPVNLADTDLHTTNLDNNGGVSKKLRNKMGFYPNESPTEIEQETVLPKYLYNELSERRKPSNVELFTLSPGDLSDSELKFLLGQGLDRNQKLSMERALNSVSTGDGFDFDELRSVVDETEEIHHATADKLKRNISVVEDNEVVTNRWSLDLGEVVDDGKALGLGMKGFERLDESDYYLMEFYAQKATQMLIEGRLSGSIGCKLLGVLPEAHHLMPRNSDSDFADIVKRNFTFHGRRSDFPFILDTQNPSQLPKKILNELNHVFIGADRDEATLSNPEWKKVLNLMNLNPNPQRDNKKWSRLFQSLGHRDFVYLNQSMRGPGDAEVVRFLAPLTCNP